MTVHPHFDPATLIRQRAAEIDRIVTARHHRNRHLERVGTQRSTITRVVNSIFQP